MTVDPMTEAVEAAVNMHYDALMSHESVSDYDAMEAAVNAAVPILRAQFAEEVIMAILSQRFVCPNHAVPDCSPLLNGCSLPNHLVGQMQTDAAIARNLGTK